IDASLRARRILLPAAAVLERIGLAARALARKQTHKAWIADISEACRHALERLLMVDENNGRTPLTWLREWSEAPTQKNLAGIVERLHAVRTLGIEPDREQRIHRARYAAIVRETAVLSAQHVSRFDERRRLATLVVFAREMEAVLTDAGIAMFDKMLGSVFRKAERRHKTHLVDRAMVLDTATRTLLGLAKAMLAAQQAGDDPGTAVERLIGWERLSALVEEV